MEQINKLRTKYIVLFCIVSLLVFGVLNYFKDKNTKNYLAQTTNTYVDSFHTIHDQFEKLSYIIYTGIEHSTNLTDTLKQYKKDPSQDIQLIRQNLLNTIEKRYTILKEQNIKSINIILWDDSMLLSMKNTKAFGRKISEKRKMIQAATQNKKAVFGYEIGKYGEGFRFIYPILSKQKQYLGVVELVFDPVAITSSIIKQYDVLSNFFIQSSQMDPQFLQETKEYHPSQHHGFLFSDKVIEKLKKISNKELKNLYPSQETSDILYKNFFLDTPSSLYDDTIRSIFTTIPIIHPLTNTMEAVLTVRSDGEKIHKSIQYFNILKALSIGLVLIFYIALYIRTISQFKSEENSQKIKQLQERFELAMEATKDGIWDWDPTTNKVYYSTTWKKMMGYEEDEIEDHLDEWRKRVHIEDIQQTYIDLESHLNKQTKIYENIHRLKHKDGHWLWVLDRGKALFDDKGKPYRMIGFHTDISKQKQLEAEALNKERQLFNQDKMVQMGEMIGNIAHQWRQPLSVIATLATGMKLKKEFNSLEDTTFYKNCDQINDQAQYLSETIDTFRDFIKEQKEQKEFILQERVEEILKILEASLTNHFITLNNEIKNTDPIKITLVASELDQVIINIINNAKDAFVEKNTQNAWIKLELFQNDNNITLTIEDNAGGIPEDVLPKIFDPYFSTKHKSLGTGLGLHMCYKIVNNSFNGKLYAKNTQNGAKFFIEIPNNYLELSDKS